MDADTNDWRVRKVREWLLLVLRFALTREPADRWAVLALADEMDSLGMRWRPSGPRFFARTSAELCDAIVTAENGSNNPVLRRHLARIDDLRLRRAFRAAVGLPDGESARLPSRGRTSRQPRDLWKGLPPQFNAFGSP
jgi:hypothetical protein